MAALEKPLEIEKGWQESKAPELIKWDKPGETVSGVLQRIDLITLDGKRVQQFLIALGDRQFKFLGTYDISQKLNSSHLGCALRIKYLGTDDNIRGGPNGVPMKVFSILFKAPPRPEGGPISDEDIPF
jgi:hypothetical protein